MPVAAAGIESDDFSFRIDAVDVAAVGRGEGGQLRFRGLADIGLPEVDAARKSFCIDVRNRAPIGIECQHPLERRRLVDCPDYRIEIRIAIDATSASSARYAKEQLVGA